MHEICTHEMCQNMLNAYDGEPGEAHSIIPAAELPFVSLHYYLYSKVLPDVACWPLSVPSSHYQCNM